MFIVVYYIIVCCVSGLVRFATQRYSSSKSSLKQRCMHLTNYSVNKKAADYQSNTEDQGDGVGSKWSFSALQRYLAAKRGVEWSPIWQQVSEQVLALLFDIAVYYVVWPSVTYSGRSSLGQMPSTGRHSTLYYTFFLNADMGKYIW